MAIRYSAFDDAKLHAWLEQLVEQQHSGVASVSYNGETTVFSSPANIEAAISGVEKELARRWARRAAKARRSPLQPQYPQMPGKGFDA
ncbi:hypothetical protein [Paracoccus beibuensis]|uniref:hypothetical protein n=1 Tax=Paracoccus beibuensis TaxID=547602 RepID=UPI00223EFC41|nr:hypothetical protein [Paracoccus beibuensis]